MAADEQAGEEGEGVERFPPALAPPPPLGRAADGQRRMGGEAVASGGVGRDSRTEAGEAPPAERVPLPSRRSGWKSWECDRSLGVEEGGSGLPGCSGLPG